MKLRNNAFLVVLQQRHRAASFLEESLAEMRELIRSADMRVVDTVSGKILDPSPSHFVREGKLEEIRDRARRAGANVLMFNVDLTPAQARNIERFTGIPAMDRTGLILDIFGKRASSREGKLQVELAHLQYRLPRLGGLGTVMSRIGGGFATKGPGEPELEHDRRKIRSRIQRVKEELEKVHQHRQLIRSGRRKRNFATVVLVGYTNAGKSTLLNAMTGAGAYVADKLFATLDPKTRLQSLNGRRDVLFVDTVGFLRELPHGLIESFHATLEEVAEADALIHIVDASGAQPQMQKEAVDQVLTEIHASHIPVVLALNKADLIDGERQKEIGRLWPDGVLISAKAKWGMNSLLAKLMSLFEVAPPSS